MRVSHSVVLPYAALVAIAIQASQISASINPEAELRDVVEHRTDFPANRSLMAHEDPELEERMIVIERAMNFNGVKKIVKTISDHARTSTTIDDAEQVLKKVTKKAVRVDMLKNHYFNHLRPSRETTSAGVFARYLVDVYGEATLAKAIGRLDYGAPQSERWKAVNRLIDSVASLWKAEWQHPLPVVLNRIDTDNDVDFFRPTVVAFLKSFAPDDEVNAALFAYFNTNISRLFSAQLQAKRDGGADIQAIENSKQWLFQYLANANINTNALRGLLRYTQTIDNTSQERVNNSWSLADEDVATIIDEYATKYRAYDFRRYS